MSLWIRCMTLLALLPASLASAQILSLCRAPTAAEPCPIAYQVHQQSVPGPAVNLLILGDGYRDVDLPQYRCAVDKMVQRLRSMPPYSDYACRMNIYRIDLVTGRTTSGVTKKPTCQNAACVATPPASYSTWGCPPPYVGGRSLVEAGDGSVGLPTTSPACAVLDLETQLCFNNANCKLIGPTSLGEQRIEAMSACVADVDAVLILAQSGTYSGRALVENDPPYAVATLWGIGSADAWHLPAHELGHALFGLLDEYEEWCENCDYRTSKNVVSGGEVKSGFSFPWRPECSDGSCASYCSQEIFLRDQPCVCPAEQGGQPCCPPFPRLASTILPPPLQPGTVGLVEGGWYRSCGYYRAQQTCRMRDLKPDFCAGCRGAVHVWAAGRGIQPCPLRVVPPIH